MSSIPVLMLLLDNSCLCPAGLGWVPIMAWKLTSGVTWAPLTGTLALNEWGAPGQQLPTREAHHLVAGPSLAHVHSLVPDTSQPLAWLCVVHGRGCGSSIPCSLCL